MAEIKVQKPGVTVTPGSTNITDQQPPITQKNSAAPSGRKFILVKTP